MDASNNIRHQIDREIERFDDLIKNGQLDESRKILGPLFEHDPENPRILEAMSTLAFLDGNSVEAKKLLQKSLQIDSQQPTAWLNLSAILFSLGEYGSALAAVDSCIAHHTPNHEIWNTRGTILSAQGRFEDALHDIEKSLKLQPDYLEGHYNRATVQQKLGLTEQALTSYQQVINLDPEHIAARYNVATLHAARGNRNQALNGLSQVISANPGFVDAHIQQGRLLFDLGRLDEALAATKKAIALAPEHPAALFQSGSILLQQGNARGALDCFMHIRALAPNDIHNLLALGIARFYLKDYLGAIEAFDAVIAIAPSTPEVYNNKGLVLHELGQYSEAIANYEKSRALQPGNLDALYNQANALREHGELEGALALYDKLLEILPDHIDALTNKAATLDKLKQHEDALKVYYRVLDLSPADAEVYFSTSRILAKLNRSEPALNCANKALKLDPKNIDALYIRAQVLLKFGLVPHAMLDTNAALLLKPRHALSNFMMGSLYEEIKQPAEALSHLDIAAEENESIEFLLGKIAHLRMHLSDWENFQSILDRIQSHLDQGKPVCQPFELHSLLDAPECHRKCAEIYYEQLFRVKQAPEHPPFHPPSQRIHIAYFSSDIGDHPVAHLMAGVFDSHDRDRFEVTLFLLNNHADGARNRICSACERIVNAEFMTDEEVVELSRSLKVDIAIDLNGYTSKNRTGIFARRAAPLQINYIGFLGTMGSECHDYIIGDPVISPIEHEHHFSEKIIQLPCYQANDDKIPVEKSKYQRKDFGLPDDAFVFCSFNANYKVTPTVFTAWMNILRRVPNSVLWFYCKGEKALTNIHAAASAHGIAKERLIVASRLPYVEHIARHQLADLFLDTTPYNAGATASNALYAGLPIITCCGKSFCSRYGASLLKAVDLPELITQTLDAYTDLAEVIAQDKAFHTHLKEKLAKNIRIRALFDTRTFTTSLEDAYQTIHRRHHNGLPPAHIRLDAPSST